MSRTTTLHEARAALSAVSARTADLVGSAPDTSAAIPKSPWTVQRTAIHLVVLGFRYAGMVHGEPTQYPALDPADCARRDDELSADIPESHPAGLTVLIGEATERLLSATVACPETRNVLFDGGVTLAVRHLLGIAVAEHVLHGYDIAVAVRRPWRIDPDHATLALSGCAARDGRRFDRLTSGVVEHAIGGRCPVDGEPPRSDEDAVTVDPVAVLLVGARRMSYWTGIALGLLKACENEPEQHFDAPDLFGCP